MLSRYLRPYCEYIRSQSMINFNLILELLLLGVNTGAPQTNAHFYTVERPLLLYPNTSRINLDAHSTVFNSNRRSLALC